VKLAPKIVLITFLLGEGKQKFKCAFIVQTTSNRMSYTIFFLMLRD